MRGSTPALNSAEQRIDDLGPHARVAARQAHGLGREHQPHHAGGQRLARAGAVRQHEVALQLGQAVGAGCASAPACRSRC